VGLITAPPGDSIQALLIEGRNGWMPLEPVLDGQRLHEMSGRSPVTEAGGYVQIELAPVHAPKCAGLITGGACDCGAQAMFERLVLVG
jgi:hypothetical protein